MARRGVSDRQRQASALQAGRRAASRGERPHYRLRAGPDGRWVVIGCEWLSVPAAGRREALATARAVVAAWLEVAPEAVDVEI